MKKLLTLIAVLAALAVVPSALASGKTAASVCPTDVQSLITNVALAPNPGGLSTATFTIPAGCVVKVSLVSYTAPAPVFTWDNAAQQVVFDQLTENLGAGVHTMSVQTPDCYYQLDLVEGEVIPSFGPYATDPNNFYTPQGRLAASANGGTSVCVPAQAVVSTASIVKTKPQVKADPKPKAKKKAKPHKQAHAHSSKPKALPYTR